MQKTCIIKINGLHLHHTITQTLKQITMTTTIINSKVIVIVANVIATITGRETQNGNSKYYLSFNGKALWNESLNTNFFLDGDISLLDEITILSEVERFGDDIVFVGEDAEGNNYDVFISEDDIANYFDIEAHQLTTDYDYQDAGQHIFSEWIKDSKSFNIELITLTMTLPF